MCRHPKDAVIHSAAGFTLLEVLVAISIFAVGLLGVAGMQMMGIQGNSVARSHTHATTWGTDRIERLMTVGYDHADLTNGNHGPVTENDYSISWTVTDNDPIDNCKAIRINVGWTDKGVNKNSRLTHYKADI
jgi:type IV pilus assembly protein PilV